MTTPQWTNDNAQKHYEKRIKKDDYCWREILNIEKPMTIQEYKHESCEAYKSAVLEYEVEPERHPRSVCRIDKRTIKTITRQNRKYMVTCYHEHYGFRHKEGSTTPSIENVIEFIDDIESKMDGDLETVFSVELVQGSLSNKKLRKSALAQKIKLLQSKCAKDS